MAAGSGKHYSNIVFSALLAASVIGLVVYFADDVLAAITDARLNYVAAGLVCFIVNYLARATRLHWLTQRN